MSIFHNEFTAGLHLVQLSGPLTVRQVDELRDTFTRLARRGAKRVLVNLADVPLIDSVGLASLIAGYRVFGSDRRNFLLAGLQDQPRLLFDLTGFDRFFVVFDSVAAAVTAQPGAAVELPLNLSPDYPASRRFGLFPGLSLAPLAA